MSSQILFASHENETKRVAPKEDFTTSWHRKDQEMLHPPHCVGSFACQPCPPPSCPPPTTHSLSPPHRPSFHPTFLSDIFSPLFEHTNRQKTFEKKISTIAHRVKFSFFTTHFSFDFSIISFSSPNRTPFFHR